MAVFLDFGQKEPFEGLVLSAKPSIKIAASQQLAAILILYTYKNTYKLKGNPSPIQMRQYHEKSKGGKIIL